MTVPFSGEVMLYFSVGDWFSFSAFLADFSGDFSGDFLTDLIGLLFFVLTTVSPWDFFADRISDFPMDLAGE